MPNNEINPADMGLTKHSDFLPEEAHKETLGKPAHRDGDKPSKVEDEGIEGRIDDQRNGDDDPETQVSDGGDSAMDSAAPLGVMERLDLIDEIGEKRNAIGALGNDPMAALEKIDILDRIGEIRILLGVGVTQAPANRTIIEPSPPEVTTVEEVVEHPEVKRLREVSEGKNDGDGLSGMFGIIQEACNKLNDDQLLTGDAEIVANAAITHWAEMEERLNG